MLSVGGISIPEAKLRELCQEYGVRELCMFGSRARGDNRPDSDVDILVDFLPETRIGLIGYEGFRRKLEELFGHDVDLAPKYSLKPIVRDQALPEAKPFYEAP